MFKSIFALFKLLPKLFKSGKAAGLLNHIAKGKRVSKLLNFGSMFKRATNFLTKKLVGIAHEHGKTFVKSIISEVTKNSADYFSSTRKLLGSSKSYVEKIKTKFTELKALFKKKEPEQVETPKERTIKDILSETSEYDKKSYKDKISHILKLAIENHKRVSGILNVVSESGSPLSDQITENSKAIVESILQMGTSNTTTIQETVSKNTDLVLNAIKDSNKSTSETLVALQSELVRNSQTSVSQVSLDHLEEVNNQNTQRILEATQAANAEPTESEQDKTTTGIMQSLIETFIAVVGGVWILAAGLILPYIKPIAAIVGKVWDKIVEVAKYVGGIVQRIIHRVTWEVGRIGASIKAVVPGTGYDWDDFNREGYNEYKGYPDDIAPKPEVREIKPKTMSVAEALTTEPNGHVQGLITESDPNIPKDNNEKPKIVKTESPKMDIKGGIGASADTKGSVEAKASVKSVKDSPKTGDNISTLAEVNETKTQKNVADESADKLAAKQAEGTDKLSQKLDQNAQKIEETSKTPPKTVIIDRETIKTVHSPIELDRGGIR